MTNSSLASVSIFSNLDDKYLKTIDKACTERSFSAGEALVTQGSAGVGLFIITKGTVKVVKKTTAGSELEVATHGPGDVIGEFSVLDGAERTASVIATEDCECKLLSSWSFQAIMQKHPEVALAILPIVLTRFRETNSALLECMNKAQ